MALEKRKEQGTTFLRIEWAPLNVPLERRLQTLNAFIWFSSVMYGLFTSIIILAIVLLTPLRFLVPIYMLWIYHDRHTAFMGGRPVETIKRAKFWKYLRDYFPANLIKTSDLPPTKNYLFCTFPHGLISIGPLLNFSTYASNFHKLYPGLDARIFTLSFNFCVPFSRDIILGLGACSVAEDSILNVLNKPACGMVGVLAVGGAAESAKTEPGTYRIVLKKRKGFIRVAMKAGVDIVPVFSFGENDIYDMVKNKMLQRVQEIFYRLFGFVPLIVRGRGFFQYTFGVIPYRRPINTVVGKPISIPKIANPTDELVDTYHSKFMIELQSLFHQYKGQYDAKGENAELIVDE